MPCCSRPSKLTGTARHREVDLYIHHATLADALTRCLSVIATQASCQHARLIVPDPLSVDVLWVPLATVFVSAIYSRGAQVCPKP